MTHAFSIDVEDWYQGLFLPQEQWSRYRQRLPYSVPKLLGLLADHGVRATCFILGKVAEEHPGLVRDMHAAGHEIASHGYGHDRVDGLTPAAFRDDLRRTSDLLETLTGERVVGYRAPYFSITADALWALDVLCEEGFLYDSSIHPIVHHRCGGPDADRRPTILRRSAGPLLEVPVATLPLPGFNLPVGGGTYLRAYPYAFLRRCLRRLEAAGETFGLYMHPWEVDPAMPRIPLPPSTRISHYLNLSSTGRKLEALFEDFTFGPCRDAYAHPLALVRDERISADPGRRLLHSPAPRQVDHSAA